MFTSDGTHVASPRYSRHALQQHVWLSLLRSAQQQLADSLNTPPRMQVSWWQCWGGVRRYVKVSGWVGTHAALHSTCCSTVVF